MPISSLGAIVNPVELAAYLTANPPRQRVKATVTTTVTLGAAENTDYVTFLGPGAVVTLPTAVGNGSNHTLINTHTAAITFGFTGAETGNGSTTITLPPGASIDLISDEINPIWRAR